MSNIPNLNISIIYVNHVPFSYFLQLFEALMVRLPVKTTILNFSSGQNVERQDDASQIVYL